MSRVKEKNWTCAIRFGLFESLLANFETYRSKAKTFDMHHETADGRGTNMIYFPNNKNLLGCTDGLFVTFDGVPTTSDVVRRNDVKFIFYLKDR